MCTHRHMQGFAVKRCLGFFTLVSLEESRPACMTLNNFVDKWLYSGLVYRGVRQGRQHYHRWHLSSRNLLVSHQGKQGKKWLAPLAKQRMSSDVPAPYTLAEGNISSNSIYSLLCRRLQNLVRAIEIWQWAVNRHQQSCLTAILHLTIRRTISPHKSQG